MTAAHGPTQVVPGSHRTSVRRLRWEYARSLAAVDDAGHGSGGSFRVDHADLPSLGLPPPHEVHCRGNSLVVVNTKAFHRAFSPFVH